MPKIQEPAVKKTTKPAKVAKPEVEKEGQYGVDRDHDLPWSAKKVALFKALKQLKAVNETKAATAQQIVDVSAGALTPTNVRHYSYHAKAGGLIELAKVEGAKGYSFYLTAAGNAINPDKALAQQEKDKAAKAAE